MTDDGGPGAMRHMQSLSRTMNAKLASKTITRPTDFQKELSQRCLLANSLSKKKWGTRGSLIAISWPNFRKIYTDWMTSLDGTHRSFRTNLKDGNPPSPADHPSQLISSEKPSSLWTRRSVFPTWVEGFPSSLILTRRWLVPPSTGLRQSFTPIRALRLIPFTLQRCNITSAEGQTHRFDDPVLATDCVRKNIKKLDFRLDF